MNKIDALHKYISSGEHRSLRTPSGITELGKYYSANGIAPEKRMADRFVRYCAAQKPIILDGQKIVFMRSTADKPCDVFTEEEWAEKKSKYHIHELGYMSNVTPDYERVISKGLLEVRKTADENQQAEIDAIIDLADRYKAEAERIGRTDIAENLSVVPRYAPKTLAQALQFFRIIHYSLWLEGTYHVTTGRFDKYMRPYYEADKDKYTAEELIDLLRDFFLSFNIDNDLYHGIQQGDNGQSMILGGIDENGNDVWCGLSSAALVASGRNHLIDPKINMRVNKDTPRERYIEGSRLTAVGMGFPQYENDDIVIPALERLGYAHKDACNYGVAACWEFIVPGNGCDVANIAALSFAKTVDTALHSSLEACKSTEDFIEAVDKEIRKTTDGIMTGLVVKPLWFMPSPLLSMFFDTPYGDISKGSLYNNFGIHGTGIATAADSVSAIAKYVFEEKKISAHDLIEAIDSDFALHGEILPYLRNEAPKMGQRNGKSADYAAHFLSVFADSLEGRKNCRGGVWRAGTGSAMYYLWHAAELGASPDGRRKGEALGTNYSPSLFAKTDGPVAVIDAFTAPDLTKTINGGPLTFEFDSHIFDDDEDGSIGKVADLVRYYIHKGGHQMQLNAVSREKMLDAQAHPENYRSLIVRIWGWSAYFVELDKEYQDHVISRYEYRV